MIFENDCIEGVHLISSLLIHSPKKRNPRVLDVANEAGCYSWIDPSILSISEYPQSSFNAIEINYISEYRESSRQGDAEISLIQENEIKSNYYDLIIIRDKLNKTFEDALNMAFSAVNNDGIVTFNLIDHHQIEKAIKIAQNNNFYPCSVINLFCDYNTTIENYEFVGKDENSRNKYVYDILGYTSITFTKNKGDIFSCIYDCDSVKSPSSVSDTDYYYNAALEISSKIHYSIYGHNKATEIDEFGNTGEYIKFNELGKFIKEIKSAYGEYQKIYFNDYFEVDLPKHKILSELDRDQYYYLSPSILVHRQLDNVINNFEASKMPELEIRKIIGAQISEGYIILDSDLNILPDMNKELYYNADKEVHGVNQMQLNNVIDIEKTLLYNLIRIKPIGDITLDYLKMYFYNGVDTIRQNELTIQDLIGNFKLDFYIEDKTINTKTLNYLSEKVFFGNYGIDTWHIVTIDVLKDSYILVDPIEKQSELIHKHKEELKQKQIIEEKEELAAWFGKALIFDKIKELEFKAKKMHEEKVYDALKGFETTILAAKRDLNNNIKNKDQEVSIYQFYKAFEIYLRLKIFTNSKFYKEKLKLLLYQQDINHFTLSELNKILKDNSYHKYLINLPDSFNNRMKVKECLNILKDRNLDAHTATKYVPADIASKTARDICNAIVKLEKIMI